MEKKNNGCSMCSCGNDGGCCENSTTNLTNLHDYVLEEREIANIITYTDILISEKTEILNKDTGTIFTHIDNAVFIVEYEGLSFNVSKFIVFDNIPEIRFYNSTNDLITTLNIENKTTILTEFISEGENTKLILELDDMVYMDHDENKFPRIRSEFYTSIRESENLFICNIYIKPSSKARELLAYKLELPNMSREQAVFAAQRYIDGLEVIKDIIRVVSVSKNAYIVGLDHVIRIDGFGYGGILLDNNNMVPYHYLGNLENSAIVFDRTIYTSSSNINIKIDNGKYEELSDEEMETIVQCTNKLKSCIEISDTNLEEVIKEYDDISMKLNRIFNDPNNTEDISIIINDNGNISSLSLHEYGEMLLNPFKE